jgi:hypothetical protein
MELSTKECVMELCADQLSKQYVLEGKDYQNTSALPLSCWFSAHTGGKQTD